MKTIFWLLYLMLCGITALLTVACVYSLMRMFSGRGYGWLIPASGFAVSALQIMRDGKSWLKPPDKL